MNLLELREEMKRKKPDFVRQDFHKKRLRKRWVKPRGLHSKVRLKKAGHPRKVSTGYGSPKEVRGLSKEGLKVKIVYNSNELNRIDKEKEGIIIGRTVGLKNKILLLKMARERGIKVLNINADEYLKRKEEEIRKKTEEKKIKEGRKEKKGEKKEKKEERLEEKLSDEEKKEIEKREKDKLLTKREV